MACEATGGSRAYGDNAWAGKPVAVMSTSIGAFGSIRAQYHPRQTFVVLDMHPLNQPEVATANAEKGFGADGELQDDTARRLIGGLLEALRRRGSASLMRPGGRRASPANSR